MTKLRVRYQTHEFDDVDIHLCTLRNKQEFYDPDGEAEKLGICSAAWPIFGIIWPSALVMAHYLKEYDTSAKRILEIGCGIAVSSHLLNERGDDITATDYHPSAGTFLARNTRLNERSPIPFECVDWASASDTLDTFDMIIGSDVIYGDKIVAPLANFINRHANPSCEIVLVDAGRGQKTKMSKHLEALGFSTLVHKPLSTDYLDEAFKGYIMTFKREE